MAFCDLAKVVMTTSPWGSTTYHIATEWGYPRRSRLVRMIVWDSSRYRRCSSGVSAIVLRRCIRIPPTPIHPWIPSPAPSLVAKGLSGGKDETFPRDPLPSTARRINAHQGADALRTDSSAERVACGDSAFA